MTDPEQRGVPNRSGLILFTLVLGSSLAFIDGTVVTVALPFVQEDLGTTAAGVQWVVQAYALFLASLMLVGGSLGDRYGRRNMFLLGVLVFTVASIAAGVAPN
ncbi:MAG: MFS transporter, partial [Chloroflexota bacterium]|nr:MFS transporter [Chloroflexota bacterium]